MEDAVNAVKQTLAGQSDEPIGDRVRKMVAAFGKFGVKQDHIESYVGFEIDLIDSDTLIDLMSVFNSIKSGDFKPSQYFSDLAKKEQDKE